MCRQKIISLFIFITMLLALSILPVSADEQSTESVTKASELEADTGNSSDEFAAILLFAVGTLLGCKLSQGFSFWKW